MNLDRRDVPYIALLRVALNIQPVPATFAESLDPLEFALRNPTQLVLEGGSIADLCTTAEDVPPAHRPNSPTTDSILGLIYSKKHKSKRNADKPTAASTSSAASKASDNSESHRF